MAFIIVQVLIKKLVNKYQKLQLKGFPLTIQYNVSHKYYNET